MHFYKLNDDILIWKERVRVKIKTQQLQVIAGKVRVEFKKTKGVFTPIVRLLWSISGSLMREDAQQFS